MFKPSKSRTEAPPDAQIEAVTSTQDHPPPAASVSFRESLIALLTEVGAMGNRLKTASAGEMPAGAGSILQILERHGAQTVPQIARKRVTSRQNIQILVNRLAGEGLIEFTDNPAHKRSVLVTLTNKAGEMLGQAGKRQQEFLDRLAKDVPEQDLISAAELLRKIREAILEQSSTARHGASTETFANPISPPRKSRQVHAEEQGHSDAENVPEGDLPFNLL